MPSRRFAFWFEFALTIFAIGSTASAQAPARNEIAPFIERHCVECHNADSKAGGLALDSLRTDDLAPNSRTWEKVTRRLVTRQMPPSQKSHPAEADYNRMIASLEQTLDRNAAEHPNPGRTDAMRRLTRTEYQNAIRDLLALDSDATTLLPADESSHGFDNITVGDLSPTLLDRYITAAQKIARLALGTPSRSPGSDTFRIPGDVTQEEHVEGLPIGTRGGTLIPYTFPRDGKYEIQVRLTRDRNEHVEGLRESHELEFLIDRARKALLTVKPPRNEGEHLTVDSGLKATIDVPAGPHQLGVTFIKKATSLLETKRQPYQAHFNMHRHPRQTPAVFQVTITGPIDSTGPGDTPSRRRIFVRQPKSADDDEAAREILTTLLKRAYRRPVTDVDLAKPLAFFRQGRQESGFDSGIELALSAILINPNFLFRVEADPPGLSAHTPYRLTDLQLASRLSFFLWSSIPDDELLDLASRSELSKPAVLERQVKRMLADSRSSALVTNFASQWLHLRNLESITPDLRLFPDFDDNLRQAFRRETELNFESLVREDRDIRSLLKSNQTYLNERLAKHYGIPHIYGSHFRLVKLDPNSERGGLLRQGSVLTVTSYATRTSPVIRGKWILDNLIGTPPPPPPANVPALKDNTVSSSLSVRERLAEHRANPACAGCHKLMDPAGFALENFDAVGRWRSIEEGKPIDASGGLPDGRKFSSVAGLEQALLDRPEIFASALTEKLLTYAVGRVVDPADGPAIRQVVRAAKQNDYRFSSLIVAIVQSTPFQMRISE